jgi:hypothetical protein
VVSSGPVHTELFLLKTSCHVVQRLIKSSRFVSRFNKLKLADVSGTISVPILRASEVNRTRHEARTERDGLFALVVTSDALRMGTDIAPETSASFSLLTLRIAREDFINSCRRESF